MDRREAMPMSGPASFYMQRGMSELHGQQGVRSLSNPGMPFQSNIMGSSSGPALVVEPNSNVLSDGLGVGASSMQPTTTPLRRKRGRPRKYGPDGKVSLALSSASATPQGMSLSTEKRGRGRPPGSGRKQHSTPFGELVSGSAGVGFTPHVITVAAGEDIAAKLLAFAQQGPRAVCILSANGSVSTVTLRQPSTSGGTVTYEGRFDILCMSGSFLLVDDSFRNRSGGLSISLASPDGHVIGGGVGGMLIAASPVQVIAGSFTWATSKTKPKIGKGTDGGGDSEMFPANSTMGAPPTGRQSQNLSPSTSMGTWASPQAMDMRNCHVDIDLMRG
uniref:AT-hook motif nuclear-localized protein n=1 Tax=Opuntia streptacantha TaxID=393608 RepID=A0A7C8YGC1_OPUST